MLSLWFEVTFTRLKFVIAVKIHSCCCEALETGEPSFFDC